MGESKFKWSWSFKRFSLYPDTKEWHVQCIDRKAPFRKNYQKRTAKSIIIDFTAKLQCCSLALPVFQSGLIFSLLLQLYDNLKASPNIVSNTKVDIVTCTVARCTSVRMYNISLLHCEEARHNRLIKYQILS